MKRLLTVLFATLAALSVIAHQKAAWSKLSPMLRQIVRQQMVTPEAQSRHSSAHIGGQSVQVCALARINAESQRVVDDYGCQDLGAVGKIHILSIPAERLAELSLDHRIDRIEARPLGRIMLDSTALCVNAVPVRQGWQLPQAFTGRGVTVGLMDIGFDLTHPTFYSRDTSVYRIDRLWDMLATDTVGSPFYVGRDYIGRNALLALGSSRDGSSQSHGTHTAGIAAGSGYDSPYRGLASEADICLVANATSNNADLIDSTLYDRYTFATDVLGFKYLFDSAREKHQPCVVSFSEGAGQDFWGYDQLYYEMLDSLLGPGRIMVSSAGNRGHHKTWFLKPAGVQSEGLFVSHNGSPLLLTLKSAGDFSLRIVYYGQDSVNDTLSLVACDVLRSEDSVLIRNTLATDSVIIQAYPNCYDKRDTCYDLMFCSTTDMVGTDIPLSVEILQNETDVEGWHYNGTWKTNSLNPRLNAGVMVRNVMSPSSAPRVISVGATTNRDSIMNVNGVWKRYWLGSKGQRAPFSSVGPTMDGRIKPDVMAPGNNIVSAYSSFFMESHPDAEELSWDVSHFGFGGRTYAWQASTGTSMSCPVVAGIIALWLQAKPDLTPEEVLDVIAHTCRQPEPSLDYPNNEYGYGEIDAYAGLLYLLGLSGMNDISDLHTSASVTLSGRQLTIGLPAEYAESTVGIRLYNMSGRQVVSRQLEQLCGVVHLTLPQSLPTGVYAVQLDGPAAVKGSTLIRLDK